jgi:hypothetical protein
VSQLWPRLSRGHALVALEKVRAAAAESLDAVRALADTSHPHAAPIATGGTRVSVEQIQRVQSMLREVATGHRYPLPLTTTSRRNRADYSVATIDRAWSVPLHEAMNITPADATSEGVWSFLSIIVVPELSVWRFGTGNDERFLGVPRNTFRRLWTRVEILGPELLAEEQRALGEDELVQIMERTNVASSRRLARAMVSELLEVKATVPRSPLMRDFSKRIRRTMPVLALDCLDDDQLRAVTADAMARSVAVMTKE